MNKRLWLVKGIAAFAFGSSAIFFRTAPLPQSDRGPSYQSPAPAPPPAPIERRPRMIVCSGRVESVHGEVDVSALIAGRLDEVRVTEGDTVREGDILAV